MFRALQNGVEHGRRQFAGERVLLADVVGAEQVKAGRELQFGGVTEARARTGDRAALARGEGEGGVPGDSAQGEDDALTPEESPFGVEEVGASGDFVRGGFIAGWGTAGGGADVAVGEFEAVVARGRGGLVGQAGAVESGIKEVAAVIAGEDAAGAVGAVGAGGEADDPDAGLRIAEAGYGACPISPVGKGAALLAADGDAVGAQTRAAIAGDDASVKERESCGRDQARDYSRGGICESAVTLWSSRLADAFARQSP
jgi:hypothetical protein